MKYFWLGLLGSAFLAMALFHWRAAGGVELYFDHGLPQNLRWGDSPEALARKMGRAPDEKSVWGRADECDYGAVYEQAGLLMNFASPGHKKLGFCFKGEGLRRISYLFSSEKVKDPQAAVLYESAIAPVKKYFRELYGPPRDSTWHGPYFGDDAFDGNLWEEDNSVIALGFFPNLKADENIFIIAVYPKDDKNGPSLKLKGEPRPAMAAKPFSPENLPKPGRKTSPLETSFSSSIPNGLNFGDSPETVMEKLARDPGDGFCQTYRLSEKQELIMAVIGPPDGKPQGQDIYYVAQYIFQDRALIQIKFVYNYNIFISSNFWDFHPAGGGLDYFTALYGDPQAVEKRNSAYLSPGPRQGFIRRLMGRVLRAWDAMAGRRRPERAPYDLRIWEFTNNSVALFPAADKGHGQTSVTVRVRPLNSADETLDPDF